MSEHNIVTFSRYRADLSRALARRGKNLLEAPNLAEQVAAMSPLDLYFTVKEIGVDEAVPILSCASKEQWQLCCDFDCWVNEAFSATELDAWLAPFASESPKALARAFLSLDEELQVMFIADSVNLFDAHSDIPEMPESVPRKDTLDTFFTLFAPPKDREVDPFVLIDALYKHDMHEGFRLLTAAKWELLSQMQEQALQFREGRLQDFGFAPRQQAMRIFSPAPKYITQKAPDSLPALAANLEPASLIPALYAAPLAHSQTLLGDAMACMTDVAQLQRLESEFVYLVNAAVVAFGNSPKDVSSVMDVVGRVRDTVSLGLEAQVTHDAADLPRDAQVEAAAQSLLRIPLTHLFQLGHDYTRPLQQQAGQALRDPVVSAWLDKHVDSDDDPQAADRAFMRGLTGVHPVWSGLDPLRPEASRAWCTRDQVAQSQSRLQALIEAVA